MTDENIALTLVQELCEVPAKSMDDVLLKGLLVRLTAIGYSGESISDAQSVLVLLIERYHAGL